MKNPNPCPRIPNKIFDQKDKWHCSGYAMLAYMYNSYRELDYDKIDRDMQAIDRAMMSFTGWFNFFQRNGILSNYKNLSLEEAKERLQNGYPVIISIGFFGEADEHGITQQDHSQAMGGHFVCGVAMAPEKWENIIKFQNSWGSSWGDGGFGYVEMRVGFGYYTVE